MIENLSNDKKNAFDQLVESRQHTILKGSYVNNASTLELYWKKHNATQSVIAGN